MFGFLQDGSSCSFRKDLQALGRELPVPARWGQRHDEELQTDGGRHSHFLPETGERLARGSASLHGASEETEELEGALGSALPWGGLTWPLGLPSARGAGLAECPVS